MSSKKASPATTSAKKTLQLESRVIRITGEIEHGAAFAEFDEKITELEGISRKAITIRINSDGGSPYEALAIIGRMRRSKCKIVTEGYGIIMSAATAILAAGDSRSMCKYAQFMHHETSYVVEGKHSDIQNTVARSQEEEEQWSSVMEELTGTAQEYWLHIAKGKDLYLTAEDCLIHGVIDEIT